MCVLDLNSKQQAEVWSLEWEKSPDKEPSLKCQGCLSFLPLAPTVLASLHSAEFDTRRLLCSCTSGKCEKKKKKDKWSWLMKTASRLLFNFGRIWVWLVKFANVFLERRPWCRNSTVPILIYAFAPQISRKMIFRRPAMQHVLQMQFPHSHNLTAELLIMPQQPPWTKWYKFSLKKSSVTKCCNGTVERQIIQTFLQYI